jgi:hypothetical protein
MTGLQQCRFGFVPRAYGTLYSLLKEKNVERGN